VQTLNLCLDLNVWCAKFLADERRLSETANQALARIARDGHCGDIPVQLIVSWGMLMRLRKVLAADWGVPRPRADAAVEAIAQYARLGAKGTGPHLTLGGTGLLPLRDIEDAHVLDTALAGRAHLLVTANFDDFVTRKSLIVEPGRVGIAGTAAGEIVVAHAYRAIAWLRQGIFPDAPTIRRLLAN
jgi:hypothetical protein